MNGYRKKQMVRKRRSTLRIITVRRIAPIVALLTAVSLIPVLSSNSSGRIVYAATVQTHSRMAMSCDGPRIIRGPYANPGGNNGNWAGSNNYCTSDTYFQARGVYTPCSGTMGCFIQLCDSNTILNNSQCATFTSNCTDANACYSPGQSYYQSRMDAGMDIGPFSDQASNHPPYPW